MPLVHRVGEAQVDFGCALAKLSTPSPALHLGVLSPVAHLPDALVDLLGRMALFLRKGFVFFDDLSDPTLTFPLDSKRNETVFLPGKGFLFLGMVVQRSNQRGASLLRVNDFFNAPRCRQDTGSRQGQDGELSVHGNTIGSRA